MTLGSQETAQNGSKLLQIESDLFDDEGLLAGRAENWSNAWKLALECQITAQTS